MQKAGFGFGPMRKRGPGVMGIRGRALLAKALPAYAPPAYALPAYALAALLGFAPLGPQASAQESPAATASLPASPFAQALQRALPADSALQALYGARHFAPIWTGAADGLRRQALLGALDMAWTHGLPQARYDSAGLRAQLARVQSEADRARAELALTQAYLTYGRDLASGLLDPARLDPGIVRQITRPEPAALIAGILGDDPGAFLRALAPSAPAYAQLRKARFDLERAAAAGGWGAPVPLGRKLQRGDQGAAVIALRDRLVAMGYLPRTAVADFDTSLASALRAFQADHGLTADGVAGAATLDEVNREPGARLQAVLVALERLRWMGHQDLGARHIWVNLPDFTAQIVDDGKVSFQTVAVIGADRADRHTPEFSDRMEYLVINPTWNVPRSITVKEYLPMMQKNPNAASHINVVDRAGRVVSRGAIDFAKYTPASFPYAMKQPPSDDNALGLVKFMFPNPWNIYLHDTPSKSLFTKEVRAFSHGCIRLQQPFDFAYALLARQTDTPREDFQAILRSGRETSVSLRDPVPVHLVYFTAWPGAQGHMGYRRDIYGRDALIFDALSRAGVSLAHPEG